MFRFSTTAWKLYWYSCRQSQEVLSMSTITHSVGPHYRFFGLLFCGRPRAVLGFGRCVATLRSPGPGGDLLWKTHTNKIKTTGCFLNKILSINWINLIFPKRTKVECYTLVGKLIHWLSLQRVQRAHTWFISFRWLWLVCVALVNSNLCLASD